jgi:catechol 2,3-dioxygenase-like lactoylglutathione lyase family enzyme
MSIIFGGMRQLAFVVRDLDATLMHWTQVLGVGPFHVLRDVTFSDYAYRGKPAESPRVHIGLSWSGAFQIEIIEQVNKAPSAYLDFLNSGREGMHHVCGWYDSREAYEAAHARSVASGATLVHEAAMGNAALGTTARFAYFDTAAVSGGFYYEIAEGLVPALRPFMTLIEDSARNWDGKDPIRAIG